MEAMVNVVFGQTNFVKHIHEIPHRVSVGEMSSVESAKEEWGIKLCLTVIGHIAMENLAQVQGHRDYSFLLALALSDRNHQIVKVHSGKLKIQGFIDPDARINQSANESIDSMAIPAFGLER